MSVTVDFRLDQSKPIVSSLDEIRGSVLIELHKDMDIEEIVLKLKGDVNTTVSYVKENSKNANRVVREEFSLYSRQQILFPSKELRTRTSGKGFTLKRGKHTYAFVMQFPKGHHGEPQFLPPTLADKQGRYEIRHYLKVTVRRSSMFKSNTRSEAPLIYSPALPESMLADPRRQNASQHAHFAMEAPRKGGLMSMFSSRKVENVDFYGECTYPRVGLAQAPHPMRLSLKVRASQHVIVRDVRIQLEEITAWRASDIRNALPREDSSKVIRDLVYESVNKEGSTFELSRLVDNVICPEYLIPSFSSKLVDRVYNLVAIVTAANPNNHANVAQLVMKGQITVLPPQLYSDELGSPQSPSISQAAQAPSKTTPPVSRPPDRIAVPGSSSQPQKSVPVAHETAHLYEKPPTSDPPPYSQ